MFARSGSTWSQQAKLTASDGASEDFFGASVAIPPDGATVLVGASGRLHVGAAYVFSRSGNSWTQQAELVEPNGHPFDGFGASVAIAGGTALVGVPLLQGGPDVTHGAVFVFTGAGATWTPRTTLTSGVQFDNFGLSVAISSAGDTAVVGAPYQAKQQGPGSGNGAAYVFTGSGATWAEQTKLTASDGALSDTFGTAVALSASGNDALIGAPLRSDQSRESLPPTSARTSSRSRRTLRSPQAS